MKKYILSALASLALISTSYGAQISSYTGLPEGTSWNDFVNQMDKDATKMATHVAAMQFSEITTDSNVAAFLADPTSAKLATAITNETGSGLAVFGTSPTLTTPVLGVATATSINKVAITAPAGSATITVADGKTLTVSDSITVSGAGSYDLSALAPKTSPDLTDPALNDATADSVTIGAAAASESEALALANGDKIGWEASPASTDITLSVNSSEQFVFSSEILNPTNVGQVVKTGLTASGSAANTFAGSTGTFITSTGLNTISGKMAIKVVATPVAAAGAGGGVAGAAALGSANIVTVSSDGATKGVKLLTGVAGDVVYVINTSGTACNIFAASGGTLNGASPDVGKTIPASKGVLCICTAADTWYVFDMTALAGASA